MSIALTEPRVVHADERIVVTWKPPRMHSAPLPARRRAGAATLQEWVVGHFPEIAAVPGISAHEQGILHRLDYETSGLVAFARTPAAFAMLRAAADQGRFSKWYSAVCAPWVARDAGWPFVGTLAVRAPSRTVDRSWLEQLPFTVKTAFRAWGPGRVRVAPVVGSEGPRYETVIESARVLEPAATQQMVIRVRLNRGFRHQVRVHLAGLGFPIVGDPLYGGAPAERLWLCADRIVFASESGNLVVEYREDECPRSL